MDELVIYCDGGARGNPGPAAGAFVVTDKTGKVLYEHGEYLGVNTNNFAEYRALVLALEWLTQRPAQGKAPSAENVVVKLDSELVVKQTNGLYKVKSPNIFKMAVEVKSLKDKLNASVKFIHTPRAQNFLADSLVNKILDENFNRLK